MARLVLLVPLGLILCALTLNGEPIAAGQGQPHDSLKFKDAPAIDDTHQNDQDRLIRATAFSGVVDNPKHPSKAENITVIGRKIVKRPSQSDGSDSEDDGSPSPKRRHGAQPIN